MTCNNPLQYSEISIRYTGAKSWNNIPLNIKQNSFSDEFLPSTKITPALYELLTLDCYICFCINQSQNVQDIFNQINKGGVLSSISLSTERAPPL